MRHNSDRPVSTVPVLQVPGAISPVLPVAALCVSGRSIYKHLPGVVPFDKVRGARSFGGYMPAVGHPPCRLWSKFLAGQAKSENPEAEKALGLWVVEQVKTWGGVIEHPAHSGLFAAAGLPMPNSPDGPLSFTLYVEQRWFGYATQKPTWVYVCGVPRSAIPPMPFRLGQQGGGDLLTGMSSAARSRTVGSFAEWLVAIARAGWCQSDRQDAIPTAVIAA